MFTRFFTGIQNDLILVIMAALVCAAFRLMFILRYGPEKSPKGHWRKWWTCFHYAFWWGMDLNAYIFLASMLLISIPAAFLPAYFEVSNAVRTILFDVYAVALYLAFWGKMIFYYYFHDIFNPLVQQGKHADKGNFADIFFHEQHGVYILLGLIPYLAICSYLTAKFLSLPDLSYVQLDSTILQYALNTVVFLASILLFYWIRYGGTLNHRHKPEWDEVPEIVKQDPFMGKATFDDLVALKLAFKYPINAALKHTDEESEKIMQPVLHTPVRTGDNPLPQFEHHAKGPRIAKPKHIFFLFAESHAQAPFDSLYDKLNIMSASKKFRAEKGTVSIQNFLSAGMTSRPSMVSIMTGIYDGNMELNEMHEFWQGYPITSLPIQLKKLGYETTFWYGGALNHGSMEHFVPAVGFDHAYSAYDYCDKDAPHTWLGVYDHIFLEQTAAKIQAEQTDKPEFHFVYTTSNHGPYNMPVKELGFDIDKVMPDAPLELRRNKAEAARLGTAWYCDQALMKFVATMKKAYPDSLFIVTGDHEKGIIPFGFGLNERSTETIRERVLTSFAISHPELTAAMLANNPIGGHMNIMPTLFELIAPQGFTYYSLFPSLTEPMTHIVTPYVWEDHDTIGAYQDGISQPLVVSSKELPTKREKQFADERDALCEVTGWIVRHPELLVTNK